MTGTSPLVVVVDDDAALREAVGSLVAAAGMTLRGYGGVRDFLADAAARDCDCLLLEVHLPDGSGLALQRQLVAKGDAPPVVFVSARGDIPTVVQAMRQGALDFVEKPFDAEALLERIHEATKLSARQRRQRAATAGVQTRLAQLTSREREIMVHMAKGMASKSISANLGISVRTVEHHRARVMRKMNAASLPALVGMLSKLPG